MQTKKKERHINNKHTKTPIDQTKTKLSPQGPQWSRHPVARERRRGDRPPTNKKKCNVMRGYIYLVNLGRQGILCLLAVRDGVGVAT
jgi:hypothetical protein